MAAADAEELRRAGNAAYKAGALQEALNLYKAAAWVNPSDHLLYNNISLVQLKLGRVSEVSCCPGAWLNASVA